MGEGASAGRERGWCREREGEGLVWEKGLVQVGEGLVQGEGVKGASAGREGLVLMQGEEGLVWEKGLVQGGGRGWCKWREGMVQ